MNAAFASQVRFLPGAQAFAERSLRERLRLASQPVIASGERS
jgi:hypothetical protein